jgi:hypothetical protein
MLFAFRLPTFRYEGNWVGMGSLFRSERQIAILLAPEPVGGKRHRKLAFVRLSCLGGDSARKSQARAEGHGGTSG